MNVDSFINLESFAKDVMNFTVGIAVHFQYIRVNAPWAISYRAGKIMKNAGVTYVN